MARVQKTFQERAESLLIIGMVTGIALIAFTPLAFFEFIQVGLVVLVACTFLQIAVGNIPRDIPWRQGWCASPSSCASSPSFSVSGSDWCPFSVNWGVNVDFFSGLTKAYGANTVLDGLDLEVEEGSFTVMCGPTGAGKSVLLRLLVGLETADAGAMTLNGVDITDKRAAERAVGYVPQSFALYPHLSVRANIGYPLKLAKRPSAEIAKRVDWAAGVLSITHLLDKSADQLSGGEKQRTAVALGLLKETDIFLLDDPLVGLDYKLRERLMHELKAIQQELKATFLYTTSDSLEALTMAEKLVVLDQGDVIQQGEAMDVYREPSHRRAMELVGFPKANLLPIAQDGAGAQAGPFSLSHAPGGAALPGCDQRLYPRRGWPADRQGTGAPHRGAGWRRGDLPASGRPCLDHGRRDRQDTPR